MSESPWTQAPTPDAPSPNAAGGRVSGPVVVIALLACAAIGAGVAWWLQDSRVEAKERERAAAAAELSALATRVQAAEANAGAAAQELKKAQAVAEASSKQAADVQGQLDALRRESAGLRAERDEARSALASSKADLDRARGNDLDPGALPSVELPKFFARNTRYRTMVDFQAAGGAAVPGLDRGEVTKMLQSSLQGSGLAEVQQSPYCIATFVSVGREKVRSIGVMMLVLRTMKVPGEAGSREVAVWGQQRTSSASDAEVAGQVRGLLDELCAEFAAKAGLQASGAAAPPSGTPAPIPSSAPANAPAP